MAIEKLPPFTYIVDSEQLRWLAVELSVEPVLAIDTESNGLHAYKERVCLIQLSTRQADYIIDPFEVSDMSPLGALMSDPSIEKILHAAEYDLMTMKRDYGFTITNLFDTMIAARVIGVDSFGLGPMLQQYFGVIPDKSHQRDNWGRRPLPEDSLRYAQMDTHFLPRLRDELARELKQIGRWEEAVEMFKEAEDVPAADNRFDPEGYWNIARPARLSKREIGVLRELYLLREQIAERLDQPTFKVISNRALVNLAQAMPRAYNQLHSIKEVSSAHMRRYGHDIIEAIQRGRGAKLPPPPPLPEPPPPEIAERFTVLQQWRKEMGSQRGVESDVVMSKGAMWKLAYNPPNSIEDLREISGLGPRRIELYGEALLDVLRQT